VIARDTGACALEPCFDTGFSTPDGRYSWRIAVDRRPGSGKILLDGCRFGVFGLLAILGAILEDDMAVVIS
jgi:hypothetical protein